MLIVMTLFIYNKTTVLLKQYFAFITVNAVALSVSVQIVKCSLIHKSEFKKQNSYQ